MTIEAVGAPTRSHEAMVALPGGTFTMGSDDNYPEERPAHRRTVAPFLLDRHPVTNAEFARFVADTNHVTLAERTLEAEHYPGVAPAMLRPASLVFVPPVAPVPLVDVRLWWHLVPGASWRHPLGPASAIDGLERHPAVHIGLADARAYAAWAGKRLPSEAEWEFAARGGLHAAPYAWGDSFRPDGVHLANTWQGLFPHQNLVEDGYERTSPIEAFPANGYGLHDMIGNVWEWTADVFGAHETVATRECCRPVAAPAASDRVLKGGSHLCAPNYCQRYRPAARLRQAIDTTACHIGFRCAADP